MFICKICYDFDQLKKSYYNLSKWVFFLPTFVFPKNIAQNYIY